MALTGLIILTIFSSMAISAPFLTHYDPQGDVVSGSLDPPAWVTYFTGQTGTSQNIEFSGLNAQVSTSNIAITPVITGTDHIDLTVSSSSASGGTILVTKVLRYPFSGSPSRFIGEVQIAPTGFGGQTVATSSVGIEQVGGLRYDLWDETLNATKQYYPPYGGGKLDSNNLDLKRNLGYGDSAFNLAQIIFSRKADYSYFIEITLPPGPLQATFSITNFRMILYGNTWGALGTDFEGHDIFTQLAWGTRVSLIVGFLATFIGVGLGLIVGLIAGYLGKIVDEVLMRFTDMMLVIPGLPLLIVLVAVLGASLFNIIMVLGFLGWMGFARVVRSQVLSLRERPFIEAAKASGAGTGYITLRHIFPNIVSLTYVNLALSVPAAIVGEAALSFLGLGDPTIISWGQMLQRARGTTSSNLPWWWVIPPGLSIAVLSLSFILLGYALDEMFNPKLRKRR